MNRKQTLTKLGAQRPAEELLRLAEHSQIAADRIDYITSSRRENLDRFELQLDELCNGEFYNWRSVAGYAYQLKQLLCNLKESIDNSCEGVALTEWVDQFAQSSLLASLIYRELLNDILQRGYTKAYHYAVDYWFQLQQLSPQISVWEPYPTHQHYQQQLQQEHGRKRSFWQRVSERGS